MAIEVAFNKKQFQLDTWKYLIFLVFICLLSPQLIVCWSVWEKNSKTREGKIRAGSKIDRYCCGCVYKNAKIKYMYLWEKMWLLSSPCHCLLPHVCFCKRVMDWWSPLSTKSVTPAYLHQKRRKNESKRNSLPTVTELARLLERLTVDQEIVSLIPGIGTILRVLKLLRYGATFLCKQLDLCVIPSQVGAKVIQSLTLK